MTFFNPLFLIGLLAIVIPIILHWRSQQKTVKVKFPPVQLLMKAIQNRQRRSRFRELFLLLCRVALLSTAVIAMARLYLYSSDPPTTRTSQKIVLIMDNSLSMGRLVGDQSLLEIAKKKGRDLISTFSPFDSVRILPLIPTAGVEQETNDQEKIRHDITAVPLTSGIGSLYDRASPFISDPKIRIIFLSDRTDNPWRAAKADPNWRNRIEFIDLTEGKTLPNAAIESVSVRRMEADFRHFEIETHLNMNSTLNRGNLLLEKKEGTIWKSVDQKPLVPSIRSYYFRIPGSMSETIVRIRIVGDSYPYDDIQYEVLPSVEGHRIAFLNGVAGLRDIDRSAYFLRTALEKEHESLGIGMADWLEDELQAANLGKIDLLFILNAATLSQEAARQVESFVQNGKKVWISLGSTYEGYGLGSVFSHRFLPGRMRSVVDSISHKTSSTFPSALIPEGTLWKHMSVDVLPHSEILLQLQNGDPLLLRHPYGKGEVYLFTGSLDQSWGDFVVSPSFVSWISNWVSEMNRQDQPSIRIQKIQGDLFDTQLPNLEEKGSQHFVWIFPNPKELDLTSLEYSPRSEIASITTGFNAPVRANQSEKSLIFALIAASFFFMESLLAGRSLWLFIGAGVLPLMIWLTPHPVGAEEASERIEITQLKLKGANLPDCKEAIEPFIGKAMARVNLLLEPKVPTITLDDSRLFEHPFLWVCGDSAFDIPNERGIQRLRKFLQFGGFVFFDDLSGHTSGSDFEKSFQLLSARLFPEIKPKRMLTDHVLFQTYYLLRTMPGRIPEGEMLGVEIKYRTPMIYAAGGISTGLNPKITFENIPSERFLINLLMYALTLDYKKDQIHAPYILERKG